MSYVDSSIKTIGDIEMIIEHRDGHRDVVEFPNTVLTLGRYALARSVANEVGTNFQFYINRMIFGTNGSSGGVPKYVDAGRTGLFGITAISKPVISGIDDGSPTTAVFTSVIAFSEGVGLTLNEMALQMANGDLYSMRTFPDLNKTDSIQIVFNWRVSFI